MDLLKDRYFALFQWIADHNIEVSSDTLPWLKGIVAYKMHQWPVLNNPKYNWTLQIVMHQNGPKFDLNGDVEFMEAMADYYFDWIYRDQTNPKKLH